MVVQFLRPALWGLLVICTVGSMAISHAAEREGARRPDILFILVDDLRYDALLFP